jgi:hypothetical protein
MIMKDPVWFLIAKTANIIGGSGYHRSRLIDSAITYIDEWWLWGTKYTAHWVPYVLPVNPNMVDITNQYIREGVDGGIIKLILFIIIIALSFRAVGLSLHAMEDKPFAIKIMIWSVGVSLFAHVASFMAVNYFDQIIVFWFLLLSIISALPTGSEHFSVKAEATLKTSQ